MTTKHKHNRLITEKSPYLLQHAYNPVEWFPWSQEAFDKAIREMKPIFLSIGYSTCHWCHVMEHESFEDEEVAAFLNEHFISIKVDREERPDIDHLYMTVCQAMTGQGGWPLTILMNADHKPFFAGTYFPKNAKHGRVGIMDILQQINALWKNDRERIDKRVAHILGALEPHLSRNAEGEIGKETLSESFQLYKRQFDGTYGGFGDAPKFPTPHNLLFLLRHWHQTGEEQALGMVEKTLDAMHRGGIYDHVGYGFARYSVDREWLVPHFEKMLYDNALLAYTYIEAYQATKKEKYAEVARQIFTYVSRDMTDAQGGFYSAEDADSEGEEGKFYVWTPEEIVEILGPEAGQLYCLAYDIKEGGNFEGHSIPNLIHTPLEQFAARVGKAPEQILSLFGSAREQLFLSRKKRIHPSKDDKVLTAWNGLMIAALAKGAAVLNEPQYAEMAERALGFILEKLRTPEGRLLARYRDGEAAYLGYVDDYAFLTWGVLELYEATLQARYLELARSLTEELVRLFWDDEQGGLFFYGSDSEHLIARPKEIYDGATPSGNGVTAVNLMRLFHLTGRMELRERADRLLRSFAGNFSNYPAGYSFSMMALQMLFGASKQVVIAGERDDAQTKSFIQAYREKYEPFAILALREAGADFTVIAPALADKQKVDNKTTIYLCENFACQAPTTEIDKFKQLFNA